MTGLRGVILSELPVRVSRVGRPSWPWPLLGRHIRFVRSDVGRRSVFPAVGRWATRFPGSSALRLPRARAAWCPAPQGASLRRCPCGSGLATVWTVRLRRPDCLGVRSLGEERSSACQTSSHGVRLKDPPSIDISSVRPLPARHRPRSAGCPADWTDIVSGFRLS